MTRFLNQLHTAQLSGVLYIIEHYYKLYNQPQNNLLHDISRIKVNEFKIGLMDTDDITLDAICKWCISEHGQWVLTHSITPLTAYLTPFPQNSLVFCAQFQGTDITEYFLTYG